MSRIKGKLILVTGASSGIGEACARRFAAEGADLILWARRADRLERLAAELGTAHRVSLSLAQVDVRDRAAVNRAVEALVRGGRVPDVLINNAGLASGLAKIHEGDPDDWDRMIDTNLKGLLYVSRAILPHMVARRRGHVVNIGSIAGHQTYPMGNVSADGKELWVSGRYDDEVYVFDTETGQLTHRIKVGREPHGLCVWPQPGRYSLGHTGNMR